MFACLRISQASLTHVHAFGVRALSTCAPLRNANAIPPARDEPADAIRRLVDLVQSAAEEQDGAVLPATLLEKPKPMHANQFISPHEFTREHRISQSERRRKDPTLGPSRKHAQAIDAFRKLAIDPLDEFKNPLLLKSFVTEMGKIHSRAKTGLTWRSQRRVGKAVRRARAMGFIPLWNSPQVYDMYNSPRSMLLDWTNTRPSKTRLSDLPGISQSTRTGRRMSDYSTCSDLYPSSDYLLVVRTHDPPNGRCSPDLLVIAGVNVCNVWRKRCPK
ncbi:hypothetical protein OPQ81_004203 [Rhizoctonia solani]|nr:hypothetical protein OPQ81_004203 [Rhizoctonia solani]